MNKPHYVLLAIAFLLTPATAFAGGVKVTTFSGHGGSVETAHLCSYHGKSYVGGWLKPHYWSSKRIYVRIDVKNPDGKVIASQMGYALPTGRPQEIVQFGVSYVVVLEGAQLVDGSRIEVRYTD